MPTRIVSTGPKPARPSAKRPPKQPVLIWLSHCDRGTEIRVIAPQEAIRVHFVEELYCPGDSPASWAMAEELAYLRLPACWRKFYDSLESRVVATHFVERRRPSEEIQVQERLDWLRKLEDFRRRFSGKGKENV